MSFLNLKPILEVASSTRDVDPEESTDGQPNWHATNLNFVLGASSDMTMPRIPFTGGPTSDQIEDTGRIDYTGETSRALGSEQTEKE